MEDIVLGRESCQALFPKFRTRPPGTEWPAIRAARQDGGGGGEWAGSGGNGGSRGGGSRQAPALRPAIIQ